MVRYKHPPIYKTAMDWAVYLEQVVRNFSRYQQLHPARLSSVLPFQKPHPPTCLFEFVPPYVPPACGVLRSGSWEALSRWEEWDNVTTMWSCLHGRCARGGHAAAVGPSR